MRSVNENMDVIAKQNGLTQEKLGKLWGMQQANAGKILNGKIGLKYSYLESFANQVGMSVVDVITWPDKYVPKDGSYTAEDRQKDSIIANLNGYISRLNDDIIRLKKEIVKLQNEREH